MLYIYSERVILSVQFPPTEDFYSLEILKISSHLRSFRESDIFGGSFASISLNTNMFFMKIYNNRRRLRIDNSVKLEYCENL